MLDNVQQAAVDGRRSRVGSYRSSSLALFFYLCLAIVTTHPLWLHLADAVPGDIGDPLLNTWILAWDTHALLTDPLHLFDANIFYPLPHTLAYSEHLLSTAALGLPLGLFSGEPVVAYNLSLLLSFPLAGLGMYLLVLRWTSRRQAAFLAGLAFAFAPYRLASIAHLQLLSIQWLPFSLLALDRSLDLGVGSREYGVGRRKQGAGKRISAFITRHSSFVIFTTLQILASWYLAVFTALILMLYTLGWLVVHWRRGRGAVSQSPVEPAPQSLVGGLAPQSLVGGLAPQSLVGGLAPQSLVGLAASFLIVAGLTLPFALPYLGVLPQLQAARPATLASSFAAHPADFLTAAPFLRIAGPLTQSLAQRPGFTEENTLFLGVVTPLLALVGLALASTRQIERWRILALAAILTTSLALTFAGPYQALTWLLPALTVVRVPPRWIIPATFALAALAGYGVAWMKGSEDQGIRDSGTQGEESPDSLVPESLVRESSTFRLVFTVGVGLMMIAESFSAPLPLASVGAKADLPPIYHVLAGEAFQQPPGWAVVELPMHAAPAPEFPETKRLYASTLGWWGLVNGYSGLTPQRQTALGWALADFPNEEALEALRALGGSGVRYLIVHPGEAPLDRARWETTDRWQAERQTTLLPIGRFGPDDLYCINPYGDDLVTNPSVITDPYWSTHAPNQINVRFSLPTSGAEIRLLAYLLQPGDWKVEGWKDGRMEGGRLEEWKSAPLPIFHSSSLPPEARLTLYWQTSTSVDTSYTVFVHSLNTQGGLIGQADGPPVTNYYPTTAWNPGEVVQDSRLVPAGDHYLVGLYNPLTGERLPAFTSDGTRLANDAVVLSTDQR